MIAAARIARHAGDGQGTVAMLVRVSIETIVLRTTQHALGQPRHDPRSLKPMRGVLDSMGELPDLSDAFRVEACLAKNGSGLDDVVPNWVPGALRGTALRAFHARWLLRWNDLFDLLGESPVDPGATKQAMRQVELEIGRSVHPADQALRILLPVYEQGGDSVLTLSARRRLLAQALAVLEFRERTAHWPATLAEAGKPLSDPFDGKPLRYIPRPNGFLLYSIGKDGVDEKGGKKDEAFEFPVK